MKKTQTNPACAMALLAGALFLFLSAQSPPALAGESDGGWQFKVTPYVWVPSIDGTLNYSIPSGATSSPEVETGDSTSIIDMLDFAFMINGEARKGRWSLFTDVIYLDLSDDAGYVKSVRFETDNPLHPNLPPVYVGAGLDAGTTTFLSALQIALSGGCNLVDNQHLSLDAGGGLRHLSLDARTRWRLKAEVDSTFGGLVFAPAGSISQDARFWDGIVNLRGRARLFQSSWSLPYYFDVGFGSSNLTWQAMAGLAYSHKFMDFSLFYRHVEYDTPDDEFIGSMVFTGPGLAVSFRF